MKKSWKWWVFSAMTQKTTREFHVNGIFIWQLLTGIRFFFYLYFTLSNIFEIMFNGCNLMFVSQFRQIQRISLYLIIFCAGFNLNWIFFKKIQWAFCRFLYFPLFLHQYLHALRDVNILQYCHLKNDGI